MSARVLILWVMLGLSVPVNAQFSWPTVALKVQPVGIGAQLYHKWKPDLEPAPGSMHLTWLNGEIVMSDHQSITFGFGWHGGYHFRPVPFPGPGEQGRSDQTHHGLAFTLGVRYYSRQPYRRLSGFYIGPELIVATAREYVARPPGIPFDDDNRFQKMGLHLNFGYSLRIGEHLLLDASVGPALLYQRYQFLHDRATNYDPFRAGFANPPSPSDYNGQWIEAWQIRPQFMMALGWVFGENLKGK